MTAIEVSCNYFFYDVGRRLGIEKLDEYAEKFGLGLPTGIEIPESSGILAGPAYKESIGDVFQGEIRFRQQSASLIMRLPRFSLQIILQPWSMAEPITRRICLNR